MTTQRKPFLLLLFSMALWYHFSIFRAGQNAALDAGREAKRELAENAAISSYHADDHSIEHGDSHPESMSTDNNTGNATTESSPIARMTISLSYKEWVAAAEGKSPASTKSHQKLAGNPVTSPPPEHEWLLDNSHSVIHQKATTDGIPKVLNKVFLSKTGDLPDPTNMTDNLRTAHRSWVERNPEYEMRYFSLQMCREYLKVHFHPVFLRAYDCIQAFAGKTNLFRLAVLYHGGGWYSDWKQVVMEDNLLENLNYPKWKSQGNNKTNSMVYFWDRGTDVTINAECIQNSFLGAKAKHPVIAEALRLVLLNVQGSVYGEIPQANTGPCVLGQAYKNVVAKDPEVKKTMLDGKYRWNFFRLVHHKVGKGITTVIQHKCDGCATSFRADGGGNEYRTLHDQKGYYCQDASIIF